ncbi:unnamed protein product, partial [Laminaria digitata]
MPLFEEQIRGRDGRHGGMFCLSILCYAVARLLLWEGTIRVGGCRSSNSKSEAVIVAMGDFLPQYPLLCCASKSSLWCRRHC